MNKTISSASEEFMSSLQPQLINRTRGAELLSQCPHTDITPEIAAIAVSGDDRTPVTYSAAAENQLTQNEIMAAAILNQEQQPYRMAPMEDILGLSTEDSGPVQLLVLTNQRATLGSGELLNPAAMDEAAYRLDSPQLYVIPSSTHEVLLLSHDSGITPDELDVIIQSVNAQVVAPCDRLADHALVYDNRARTLSEARDQHSKASEANNVQRPESTLNEAAGAETNDTLSNNHSKDFHERRHHA